MKKLGRHKRAYLEELKALGQISPEQLAILNAEYERLDNSDKEGVKAYVSRIYAEKKKQPLTEEIVFKYFETVYYNITGKSFVWDSNTTAAFYTLLYYFTKNERFYKSPILKGKNPSLDKGLCLIGNYGVGKSSLMRTFWKLSSITSDKFAFHHAGKVVEDFEKVLRSKNYHSSVDDFYKKMSKKVICFDDVKTEEVLRNFGETRNVFKHIFEKRNDLNVKTYITCNYKDGTQNEENKLRIGVEEFGEKYGGRVYDRMFSDFNFIEMDWGSFRR